MILTRDKKAGEANSEGRKGNRYKIMRGLQDCYISIQSSSPNWLVFNFSFSYCGRNKREICEKGAAQQQRFYRASDLYLVTTT